MSLLKVNEVQNYNGSSLTLTASTVSTSAQLNTGGNISVTGSINVSDDSTTRSNLGLGSIATQDSSNVTITGGNISNATLASSVTFPAKHIINFASATYSTATTITSTTNGSGTSTGLSVGITPSSTSNLLLILVNIQFSFTSNGGAGFEIYDGSSVIYNDTARDANYLNLTSTSKRRHSLQTVINPSSSGSEITYTVRAFKISGTFICQDSSNPSTISICEIKQ